MDREAGGWEWGMSRNFALSPAPEHPGWYSCACIKGEVTCDKNRACKIYSPHDTRGKQGPDSDSITIQTPSCTYMQPLRVDCSNLAHSDVPRRYNEQYNDNVELGHRFFTAF